MDKRADCRGFAGSVVCGLLATGECLKSGFLTAPGEEARLDYLCAGQTLFFGHMDRPMRMMSALAREGRAAPDVMGMPMEQERQRKIGMPTRARAVREGAGGKAND